MTDTTPHPKQLEAKAKAEYVAAKKKAGKELLVAMHKEGVRFVEIQPTKLDFNTGKVHDVKYGRMTVAFASLGRNMIGVATSICHPDDKFNKIEGRCLAGLNLARGSAIMLRKPSNVKDVGQWLRAKFTEELL